MLPVNFKPKPDTLYYLVWPSGRKAKTTDLELRTANEAIPSDFITFFFYEDRAATFAIERIEIDEDGWFTFKPGTLYGVEWPDLLTFREVGPRSMADDRALDDR